MPNQERESQRAVEVMGHKNRVPGLVVGEVTAVSDLGVPSVDYSGCSSGPRPARTTAALTAEHVGRRVVLAFEDGHLHAPIVIGVLHEPLMGLIEAQGRPDAAHRAVVDGERLVLTAEKEIVLECGQASITLRKDGKVLIRGAHLLSRSSGPNRIKGASVQIN